MFYNAAADPEDYAELVSAEARADRYFAVIRNGALMGYFCFEKTNEGLELGLGMKPSYTGQGNGRAFYQTIEVYLKENLSPKKIRLAVAAFNE
ncbi:GNAT family N-acetyltransferase [Streptococcus sp. X13SY08]|uniref:GNAT family N-acetyltransferase n=1 Tax=unclassified Streptococcus TaxID=2608887 RepID=UPI0026A7B03A|nr:GNAT family N-acetyltransferase [Streptococcus sp. X13SY08]